METLLPKESLFKQKIKSEAVGDPACITGVGYCPRHLSPSRNVLCACLGQGLPRGSPQARRGPPSGVRTGHEACGAWKRHHRSQDSSRRASEWVWGTCQTPKKPAPSG